MRKYVDVLKNFFIFSFQGYLNDKMNRVGVSFK